MRARRSWVRRTSLSAACAFPVSFRYRWVAPCRSPIPLARARIAWRARPYGVCNSRARVTRSTTCAKNAAWARGRV
eukprot:7387427-Prymnesium_polylepis.1